MRAFIWLFLLILLFGGCSTKKYFMPEQVAGVVDFDGKLPAPIVDVLRDGATLQNGQFISDRGVEPYKLPKGYLFIKRAGDYYLAADRCHKVVVIDAKSKKKIFEKDFKMKAPVAANFKDGKLALVFDNDSLLLFDTTTGQNIYSSTQSPDIAVDTKIANPYFLGKLVIFPTLDGKIVVVDSESGKELRTLIVGTHKYFNNVIFLDVIDEKLIAATPNKIISVTPQFTNSLDVELSDVLYVKNRVYLLTKDGRIILTDSQLNPLKERKFNFAHYTGAIYGEFIYLIEKSGYIIAVDKDLRAANVFELPEAIDNYIFTAHDTLYYDDKYFRLNKIQ